VFAVNNFRRREWAPAIEAAGIATPARIYDLRSTFASNALAAGVSVFELARIMGTSVAMIERSYGTLIEGAGADITRRLGDFEAMRDRSGDEVATMEAGQPVNATEKRSGAGENVGRPEQDSNLRPTP
jgi:hypothetical protein